MQYIARRIQVPKRNPEIKIVAMGCIHHGAANCDEKLASFWYKKALEDPYTFIILGGDLVDGISEKDPRYFNGELARWCHDRKWGDTIIDRQYNYALQKWAPLAEKGKILWLHAGNHEWALIRHCDRNLSREWARELKIPYAGLEAFTWLTIEHGKKVERGYANRKAYPSSTSVSFYTTHGSGSGQTTGAIANRVERMTYHWDADVCLMWHLHRRIALPRRVGAGSRPRMVDGKERVVPKFRDRVAAICGTFLRSHQPDITGYGELKNYPPIAPGPVVIHIKPEDTIYRKDEPRSYTTRIWASEAVMVGNED